MESLDELRKGATDDLAKLARKQHEDPAVILHPEKRGEVEEVDPVQKGEDRRAASNARKEALLEAKRKQEEERARLAEKKPPPPEDTDSSSEDYSDHEDVNQNQRRKLTALTIRKAAQDATHVSEEESQLREILAKAESWAARAKALKPATCAGGLTEIPHEKLMAAPTLAQLKKLVDQGESLAIDCTIQLRPLRTASRQAGAWLHNSRDVRRKLNLEATTDVKLWVTTTNDSDSDDSDAVVRPRRPGVLHDAGGRFFFEFDAPRRSSKSQATKTSRASRLCNCRRVSRKRGDWVPRSTSWRSYDS